MSVPTPVTQRLQRSMVCLGGFLLLVWGRSGWRAHGFCLGPWEVLRFVFWLRAWSFVVGGIPWVRGGGECCARQVHHPFGSRPPAGSVAGSMDAGVSGAGFSCLVPSGLALCVPAGASMERHGVLTHRRLSSSHGIYSATRGSVRCQRENPFCCLVISVDVCLSYWKEGSHALSTAAT